MTIDEAIEHAEHVAANCDGECSEDHRQLAEWLKELRDIRSENEKLRSERDYWRVEQVHAYSNWEDTHKYAAKLKAENDELRYKVHILEGGNKGLQILNDSLKTDNAKLRDLVDLMLSCPMDKGDCDKCRQLNDMCEVEVLAGDLGIEVSA